MLLGVAFLALAFGAAFSTAQVAYTVDGTNGPTSYTIAGNGMTGTANPALTLVVGTTYNFALSNCGGHPFWLRTVQGTGTSNGITGVSNNGGTSGTVSWTPTATGTFYYNCQFHTPMTNTITVNTNVTSVTYMVDGTNGPVSYSITAPGGTAATNPALTLKVGTTYNFALSNCAGHPFWIKSVQGTGTSNGVTGVTNNGGTSGTVSFTPTAAASLFYNCQFHTPMTNTITVSAVAASSSSTGSSSAFATAAPSVVMAALAVAAAIAVAAVIRSD